MNKPMPLAWIPNQAGFKFIGIRHDGTETPCEVVRDEHGCHTVKDGKFKTLKEWRRVV